LVLNVIFDILLLHNVTENKNNMHITKNSTIIKLSIFLIGILSLFFSFVHISNAACVYDGENFHIQGDASTIMSPIHRLYNTRTGVHLYTRGVNDANKVLGKWHEFEYTDGVPVFCMSTSQQPNLTPIYRLYNTETGVHLYTRGETDRDKILSKWPEFEYTDGVPVFWSHIAIDAGPELYRYQGPEITVGLYAYTKSELKDNSFRIKSDKKYIIRDKNGNQIATIPANATTKVKYLDDSNHTLRIYESIPEITTTDEITFESALINDTAMVFDIIRPELNFSKYRGKIQLRYSNNNSTKRIWVINKIPLEQYIWGMGEITGTGPMEYNKMMTTAYRTYGYWKILYSTKYAIEGFKVNATPGNQLYYGYEWEKRYPRIREGAEATRGKIAKYKNDVALTPYSSWTDGKTRSFEEHWGSTLYPWCQSVKDSYGDYNGNYWDNSYKSTDDLFASGNHMVGISAHGALTLANDKNWNWDRIMKYYLNGIDIISIY